MECGSNYRIQNLDGNRKQQKIRNTIEKKKCDDIKKQHILMWMGWCQHRDDAIRKVGSYFPGWLDHSSSNMDDQLATQGEGIEVIQNCCD